jgi:hypothetical protein
MREQFRHAARGIYLEEGEFKRLRDWEREATRDTGTETDNYEEEDIAEALKGVGRVEEENNII